MVDTLFIPGQDVQCGVFAPGASVVGFKFIPTEVYICNKLTDLCFITNPTRDETIRGQRNGQIYLKNGRSNVHIYSDGELDVYISLTKDGFIKFTDKNENIIRFDHADEFQYLAIRTEF